MKTNAEIYIEKTPELVKKLAETLESAYYDYSTGNNKYRYVNPCIYYSAQLNDFGYGSALSLDNGDINMGHPNDWQVPELGGGFEVCLSQAECLFPTL